MTTTRTNRYEGTCRKCEATVPAGTGRLINEGFRPNDRNAPARWATECGDTAACKARFALLPSTIAAAERAAARHAARVASDEADLAKWIARSAETVVMVSAKTVEINGQTWTRRKIKNGVRLATTSDWSGDFTEDFASDAGATVHLAEIVEQNRRDDERRRIDALPLPTPGTVYNRKYRSWRDDPAKNGSGVSMFLGLVRVPRLGEMALCAELMEDGSWLGYTDNLHTVRVHSNAVAA